MDLVVHRTESVLASGALGTGIAVQLGASLVLTRGRASENRSHGLFALGAGTTVEASDLTIRDTRGWESSGVGGLGIGIQNGAALTLERALVSRNREVGILSMHAGSTATLSDTTVLETMHRDCLATGTCEEASVGLVAVHGGSLGASRFLVADGAFVGVQVAVEGQMDLVDGTIRGHVVGAAIDAESYDFMRLSNRVAYSDNEVNLDARVLPVPDPGDPLAGSEAR
jgi:hypothetical protein